MENLSDRTAPLWHGLNSPYILIYSLYGGLIVPVCPAVQWFIAQSAAFFPPNYWQYCDTRVCTVNDLLSMLYALFSRYISVVGDVGVRSTVSYSVSSSLLSVCSLFIPFWIFSPADWVIHTSSSFVFQGEECPQAQQARNCSCGVWEAEARCDCGQIGRAGGGGENGRRRGPPSRDEVEPKITPTWDMFWLLSLKDGGTNRLNCGQVTRTSDQFCIFWRTRTQTVNTYKY